MDRYDTLVLSGGGVKGFCILGALHACVDRKLLTHINKFVGTSIGAILCYLLIIGYTPLEILLEVYSNRWLDKVGNYSLVDMIKGKGAISYEFIHNAMLFLTKKKLDEVPTLKYLYDRFNKVLVCCTYNTTNCKVEYLNYETHPELDAITALRMSSNIPLIFDRFKYRDCFYVDGGVVDNFPVLYAESIGKNVLGIYLDITEDNLKDVPEDGMVAYISRLMYIPIINNTRTRISFKSDNTVIVKIQSGSLRNNVEFDVKSVDRLNMYSIGYKAVKKYPFPFVVSGN